MTSMPPQRHHQELEEQRKVFQEGTSYKTNIASFMAVQKTVTTSNKSEKQQKRMNTTTDDCDDDINNSADTSLEDVVKQPKVVVMKRTPSQFTDDGESGLFVSTASGGAEDSEEEEDDEGESSLAFEKEEEALAALSALTGENVYDSPTPPRNRAVLNDFPETNGGGNHKNDMSLPPLEKQHHHHHQQQQDEEDELSGGGVLASGWAWLQRSRESSRRKYLQKEAEKQLQKIRDAEMSRIQQQQNGNKNGSSFSPSSSPKLKNPTFLQMRNFDGTTTTTPTPTLHRTLSEDSSHVTTTESGEGVSAHLDFGSLQFSGDSSDQSLVPQVRVAEELSGGNVSPYILTPEQMHQIAIHVLPSSVAYCKWKRIYGLGRDGDSFDGCLRKIDSVSRTLMVVRTTRNEIFGGYADSPWNSHAIRRSQFYGGAGACLFKIQNNNNAKNDTQPKQTTNASSSNNNNNNSNVVVNVYHWTGKNRYIQLCDESRKMLAFGGGGDDGVFGLAVEEDFQKGSTGPCDTFDNEQLCSEEVFEIVDLEFWEFLTGMF